LQGIELNTVTIITTNSREKLDNS